MTIEVPVGPSGSRRYPHPPIAEAVLELRVLSPESLTVDDLSKIVETSEFPVHKPFTEVTGVFNVEELGVSAQARHQVTGHVWHTADELRHVQARREAFLYAQRAPYQDWDEFIGQAERLWGRYKVIARPRAVTRAGCRFVNRIDIPSPQVELTDYLLTTAQVPPDLPQVISGYLMHVELPMVRTGVACRIISTLVQQPSPDTTSLILDIDVWSDVSLSTDSDHFDGEVRRTLEELRRAKNDVFEACITDQTRRLFL